ncbi:DUF4224 domain-containing protein [Paraburkholderia tropica]|uniref:DUF4224 domain-containing protein n=1 Tax=Paraburkholderia tropica TaxID=92647 RepID=UPI002ABDF9C2|nr:DUF4224 domain-containing protein [Paraburkholderia tropica]
MENADPLFLTDEEVRELTGIGVGRTENVGGQLVKRTKLERQVAQLRTMGIPFHVNARGRPIIARAFFTGQRSEAPRREKWHPKFPSPQDVV